MPSAPIPSAALCCFCLGQERLTPRKSSPTGPMLSEPDGPNWTVRVIPNKFPGLACGGDMGREGSASATA